MDTSIFEDTRPYNDNEIPAAVNRLLKDNYLPLIFNYLFPDKKEAENLLKILKDVRTVKDFQLKIMYRIIWAIINKTSSGLTYSGFENLNDEKKAMLIGNHRDILLDSAILQILLTDHHLDTSEITFGSNLMSSQLAIDIGKMNKMFKIIRGGNIRDFYRNSVHVSTYMRYAITEKKQSTWIAQRNGRTKDGNDTTEMAVLKMFTLSSNKRFVPNLLELNITPLIISYEYEPCVFLKVAELYVSMYQKYEKKEDEDFQSIIQGIIQWKGNIHFVVGKPITEDELKECDQLQKNDKFIRLAQIIDKRIYDNYRLWKTNYIAYDLLYNTDTYTMHYSPSEKSDFIQYMKNGLEKIEGEYDELENIFLKIYANPVKNKEL
ncbi:MAG TPA: acyltransferase [Bacteroidales bacterium]|nr:acyltransferase [Bacteroidales bacterium]HOR82742.1 acyltransferase [Bacteroidales bacterium]HPJ91956.1 acyltransferase [Bacteroidales bacterium]